jgi:hypothetical protein
LKSSEALRLQQCIQQIDEQSAGSNQRNDVIHRVSSHFVAGFGEQPASGEKQDSDGQIEEIQHRSSSEGLDAPFDAVISVTQREIRKR